MLSREAVRLWGLIAFALVLALLIWRRRRRG